MNILFVNYGDFSTNSLNHIGGFANELCAQGHACVVAVSHAKETIDLIHRPAFVPATYEEVLARPAVFPDGKPADVIHAWTPREGVRKFVLDYQRLVPTPARVIVHLEDNEQFLLQSFTDTSFDDLLSGPAADINTWLVDGLSHPGRHQAFLRIADGVTVIVDRLREHAPTDMPTHILAPGVDFALYHPQSADESFRTELGLAPNERVVVFTGSNTFANEAEVRELYLAIALLNQRGTPTRLLRTGINAGHLIERLSDEVKRHVIELGFIEKQKLPKLLALADVLVQPGHVGAFNDFRLPSKLPEFLAMGKPVILPPTNIANLMRDGREAVFLRQGTPEEIASTCERLFADPALCTTLGTNAAAFARQHFDLAANTRALAAFYRATAARSSNANWPFARRPGASEASLLADRIHHKATIAGAASDGVDAELRLLRNLVRHIEEGAEAQRSSERAAIQAKQTAAADAEELTRQHIQNLETLRTAAEERSAALEETLHARETALASAHQDLGRAHQDITRLNRELGSALSTQDQLARALSFQAEELTRTQSALAHEIARRNQLREHAEALIERTRSRIGQMETLLAHKAEQENRLKERMAELDRHVAQLDRDLAERQSVLEQREQKIHRMQSSASWRLTSPLRAMRRAFIDRPSRPQSALHSTEFRIHLDLPSHWEAAPAQGEISGWCLTADRAPALDLRLRIDGTEERAGYGIARPDVVRAEGLPDSAVRCGFRYAYRLPADRGHRIVIEARAPERGWQVVFERELHTSRTPREAKDYTAWVAQFDTPTPEKARVLRARLAALTPEQRPLISVLMPVYNAPERWLARAIESVREQVYENWELCIADDASSAPHVRPLLERFAAEDPRIHVVFRAQNGHISAASNSALEIVRGEFVALLDHDDELSPDALAEGVLLLAREPESDLIFSDEDKIDENGRRYDPYFKPDFLPDLLLGQNCLSHLAFYRTTLMREVGGFRAGYEGSQDWDLALRIVDRTTPEQVRHIPKVLYHWRAISGSTALAVDEKDYASDAARRSLLDHFSRRGIEVELRPVPGNHWQIVYPLPQKKPLVSIVIPTRNGLDLVRTCVASIVTHTDYEPFEILIVNNASDDPATLAYLSAVTRADNIRVIDYTAPFNFSAINNFAARHARGEVLCFLNNDIEVITGRWLAEMVSHALRPEIGAVGAMLYYPNGTIQHAGVVLGLGGVANHAFLNHPCGSHGYMNRGRLAQNYSAVTAACLVVRRAVFEEVAGFNEAELAIAFNDVDLCLRIRAAGYRNLWTPFAELYHHESATRGTEDTPEKKARFAREVDYMRRTWGPLLDHDPAYNPNLSVDLLGWTLAWPPRSPDALPNEGARLATGSV